jgi:hypothetical protein
MKKLSIIFIMLAIFVLISHFISYAETVTELQGRNQQILSNRMKPDVPKSTVLDQSTLDQTNSILAKNIDNAVGQIDERILRVRVTILQWWGFISGLASIVGCLSAFFFYWKAKKTDDVVRGFFSAISAESNSILQELHGIKQISRPDSFLTLKGKVETAHSFMASLNHTISVFNKTLWPDN